MPRIDGELLVFNPTARSGLKRKKKKGPVASQSNCTEIRLGTRKRRSKEFGQDSPAVRLTRRPMLAAWWFSVVKGVRKGRKKSELPGRGHKPCKDGRSPKEKGGGEIKSLHQAISPREASLGGGACYGQTKGAKTEKEKKRGRWGRKEATCETLPTSGEREAEREQAKN